MRGWNVFMVIGAVAAVSATGVAAASTAPVGTDTPASASADGGDGVRVATFNVSLNRSAPGELVDDLSSGTDEQAATIATILQATRPDIVLLNEFDYVADGSAVDLFREHYLAVGHDGNEPIDYPFAFAAPSNTGIPSGFDLDNDGSVGGGNDAFGFGDFEGHYGMVVLSRFPIVDDEVRTFQNLLWASMPDARLPDDPATPEPADWYSPEELDVVRLSSKSHWDVPVDVGGEIVHVLAAHPTPPVFDGDEDRNGLRNADEIALWAHYVAPEATEADWIVDDAGVTGGLAADASFVIVGDLNSDPLDGDSVEGATAQLLDAERVQDPQPHSEGAAEAAELQGGANADHRSDPRFDTADFEDDSAGNLRADYVLPSSDLTVTDAGVFWPSSEDPLAALTGEFPFPSSDHRLVWVDVTLS